MSMAEMVLSFFVLSVFSVEIVLRIAAHGMHFFNGVWNWFDLIVVGLSVGLVIWKVCACIAADSIPAGVLSHISLLVCCCMR